MVEAALKGSFWRNSQHTRVQPFHSQMYKFSTTNLQEWCHKLTSCIEYNPRFFFKHSGPRFHIMSPYCGDSMQTVLYKNFPSFLPSQNPIFYFHFGKSNGSLLDQKKQKPENQPTIWTNLNQAFLFSEYNCHSTTYVYFALKMFAKKIWHYTETRS